MKDNVNTALDILKTGKTVILTDEDCREGVFLGLAEKASSEMVNQMIRYGKGLVYTAIPPERAKALNLSPMVVNNTNTRFKSFTVSVDETRTTTGIAAHERALTIRSLADPSNTKRDFLCPGHIFPLVSRPNGILDRLMYTEAAVDLARLCGAYPAGVICEILAEDGKIAGMQDIRDMAFRLGLPVLSLPQVLEYRLNQESWVACCHTGELFVEGEAIQYLQFTNRLNDNVHLVFSKKKGNPHLVLYAKSCDFHDVFDVDVPCDCMMHVKDAWSRFLSTRGGHLIYYKEKMELGKDRVRCDDLWLSSCYLYLRSLVCRCFMVPLVSPADHLSTGWQIYRTNL